jgi:protein-disulfide isomerase
MAASASGVNRFYLLLGAIALAGIAALVYQVRRPKGVSIPANVTVLAADTAGFRGYLLGSDSAKVEISEYADYQCPFCADFASIQFPAIRQQLIQTGLVRWRFRDFPLNMHPHSRVAAHAVACADEQGKFWEMHDQLFNQQDQWNGQATSRPKGKFQEYAKAIGLNVDRWEACYDARKYDPRIKANEQMAVKRGASQTPTFVIGNKMIGGAISFDHFKALVDSALVLAKADSGKPAAGGDTGKATAVPAKGPGGR